MKKIKRLIVDALFMMMPSKDDLEAGNVRKTKFLTGGNDCNRQLSLQYRIEIHSVAVGCSAY